MIEFPTEAEIRPEIVRAVKEFGCGTFVSEDSKMKLVVEAIPVIEGDENLYHAWFHFNWVVYNFLIEERELAA